MSQVEKSAQFPELEEDLAAWITSKRQEGVAVSTTVICLKAKALPVKKILQLTHSRHHKAGVTSFLPATASLFAVGPQWPRNFMRTLKTSSSTSNSSFYECGNAMTMI